jgi:hypothetical protein
MIQPLEHFIDSRLLKRLRLLEALTCAIRPLLPAAGAEHCWVVDVREGTLLVLTDSANWAVSVRYQQRELLKQLNDQFHPELASPLQRVKIRVSHRSDRLDSRPVAPRNQTTARRPRSPGVDSDRELAAIMDRLAARLRTRAGKPRS